MKHKIHFDRDGLTLAGDLFTPDGFNEDGRWAAVIVQGSFTSVKEQMPDAYAQKFADQGFVALAFDYAHYGESAGEPRQFESPAEKLADLRAAVTYLSGQQYVNAVGMVGICTSASNGAYLAAEDLRIKGFATIAGFLTNRDTFTLTYGEDGIAQRLADAAAARRKSEEKGKSTTITVYSETDEQAVNYNPTPGAYDYYTNPERGNVPDYKNEFDVTSWDTWVSLDALSRAPKITTPTIVVHSDGSAFPDQAKTLYDSVQGEKELVWADGNHFDYYDSPEQMDNAVANVARFFRTHLV
ncbi:alpha/beta hydrolase [Arthrobacter sp. ISL-28]|uniref:alpha/beta hydrolase n=1 Tax=Arthrobacter sp. ISL-28 TaxID=2819108 RepID=UPI001BED3A2F|nr:alpha/beta hydrolase [Arthrobacter sp. ISL-28]MBT2521743.1 alpha/beta hydrolase [Arthrobacter sp. ISL-28]